MKRISLIFLFLGLVVFLKAETIEMTYVFDHPKVIRVGSYQYVQFENTLTSGVTGEPSLPYADVRLLLPTGEKAIAIEVIGSDETLLDGTYNLYPRQPSRTLSDQGHYPLIINEAIYSLNSAYPDILHGGLTTSYMNGYAFALSTFTPVRYNPASGNVSYFKTIKVIVTTTPDEKSACALNNLKSSGQVRTRVADFAHNPLMIDFYPVKNPKSDDYQLLIITVNQFQANFQDLIEIYLERGIKTEIVTKETISSSMTGQDLQEKIRNYIIQEYQDHSIEFVILGGDVEHVPYRGFYCYAQSGSGYEDYDIPADLYYNALDGNWNSDGDNRWGEPGEDDLLPELAIGRFSFNNVTELTNIKHKSISYQNSPVLGEFNDAVLAGEWLYSDPETWGSDYLELLIGYHTDNGYTTYGIPEDYNYFKLYEENQSWGATDLMDEINAGRQYIHHVGHANSTYVAYMSNSDITNANFSGANGTDHNYTIFHSHGCICGAFDESDCIMEKMVSIENFAVTVIGNSRYGWFNEGQTEGPAAHLHREMVDALYHEKMNHLGEAFMECKIQTAPWVTAPGQWEEGALRWNFYDINILGDPVLSVWTDEPVSIQVSYQNAIPIGVTSTNVTVMSSGSPAENFTCSVLMNGELYGVGYTDATGNAQINFDPVFTTVGNAELIVSGYNCLPAVYPVNIIPNTGAYVVYTAHQIDDSQGNNNGLVDFGESIAVELELENVGSQQANDVNVFLTTSDIYVNITDGFAGFGNISGGATATLTDAFTFEVAPDIPDQHIVNFNLEIVGQETWTSSFSNTVNAPDLQVGTLTVDDSQSGNGDGILDPGETADIIVEATNAGHCSSNNTSATLTTGSTGLTITNGSCNLGTLTSGQTANAEFTISVDGSVSAGTGVELLFEMVSGEYFTQNTFFLTVGLIFEDFETGNFSSFGWQFSGDANWTISNQNPYEGTYCAKSGSIDDQETSEMKLVMDVIADGDITFYRKVSSEEGWDYLRFFIDNTQMDEWSGEMGWALASYPVSAGSHTFRWVYEKDYSVNSGQDCGWVDYIVFPGSSGSGNILNVNATASPEVICMYEGSQLNAFTTGGSGNYTYVWTPDEGLNNPNIPNPMASPASTTTYTVVVNDGNSTVSDYVTVTVNPVPATPVIIQVDDYLHSNAPSGNQWYNDNGPITGATGVNYFPPATGHYYVIVTNINLCSSGQSNVIYFIYTTISENSDKGFNVYPNPFVDRFTLEYKLSGDTEILITLSDKLGQQVKVLLINDHQQAGFYSLVFSCPELQPGIYFIKLESGSESLIRKLVLSK
jgi:hypothetical protein